MRISSIYIATALLAPSLAQAGIPQLEQTEWFASQLFWLVISFTLMLLLVKSFVVPTIAGVLKAREEAIHDAGCEAERFRLQAQQAQSGSDNTMRNARAKTAEMIGAAKTTANDKATSKGQKLDAEIAAQLKEAEAELSAAKTEAMASLETEAGSIAQALADKLVSGDNADAMKVAS